MVDEATNVGGIAAAGVLLLYAVWAVRMVRTYRELRPSRWGQLHRWLKRRPPVPPRGPEGVTG